MVPEPMRADQAATVAYKNTDADPPTLYENLLSIRAEVGNHNDALSRIGQRLADAEARIEELLREVGKSTPQR